MTQTAEASPASRPLVATTRAFVQAHALWIGVGAVTAAASAFLLHQLMAWPPHEDETLALFVGRDSLAGVVEHVTRDRGGAPLHFLFAYAVALTELTDQLRRRTVHGKTGWAEFRMYKENDAVNLS